MRILSRFGVVSAVFFLSFFSSTIFSVADSLIFSIKSDVTSVTLAPLMSTSTTVSVTLDPLGADLEQNLYSISRSTPCAQFDQDGYCIDPDPIPDLCKYLAMDPIDGESSDYGFYHDPMNQSFGSAVGRIFYDGKHKTDWNLAITAPCFEGECPVGHDPYMHGAPLPQEMKGKTFKCELKVNFMEPIFQTSRDVAYADALTDRIEISAVFGTPPAAVCTENCFSNVAFIPGVEASRLYVQIDPYCEINCEDRLWEPFGDTNTRKLFLNSEGKSTTTFDIYTRDVVDEAHGLVSIYKSFIEHMNGLESNHTINNWEALPYDWRLSFDDILTTGKKAGDRIYYGKATSTPFILQEIKHLASTSKTGKVTIVAHSNGGLLTKAIVKRLEAEGLGGIVDKIIFVAVPQVGTPAAIAGMLHGEDQGLPRDGIEFMLSKKVARTFAENSPGIYGLLPSANYFTYVDTPPITFTNPLSSVWANYYGEVIHSQERLHKFLTDTFLRQKPPESDLKTPNVLNEAMLTSVENLHDDLDAWQAPAGVRVIQIAGWGRPDTLSAVNYTDPSVYPYKPLSFQPKFVSDGDGTVVTPSALWMSGPNVERYWVDLAEYAQKNKALDHKDILEAQQLRDFITNIITNSPVPLPTYLSSSEPVFNASVKRLQFALHSPLSLDLFDNLGRHTGISTTTGKIEHGIPGTYYKEFGEAKYIFSDESIDNHIRMDGYASGVFTFNISEFQGDTVTTSTTFADIPTTAQTEVVMDIPEDITSASSLTVDLDGDGGTDFSLAPKLGEIVTVDQAPPITSITFTGVKGKNDWYTSNTSFTLMATDTESGVASTTYSLDNGSTWLGFDGTTSPLITKEGTTTILYYSIDNFGNKEGIASSTVKIDKSAPEATLAFDQVTQKLKVIGKDNLTSNPVVSNSSGSSVITDEAGHTLQVIYTQPKVKERRVDLRVTKLVYDGIATVLPQTVLRYKWNTKKNGEYTIFAEYVRTRDVDIEGHFRPKKNQTILMKKPADIDDRDDDEDSDNRPTKEKLPGMVVVGLKTEKGIIKTNY